jgi:hypothetical protein
MIPRRGELFSPAARLSVLTYEAQRRRAKKIEDSDEGAILENQRLRLKLAS